MKTDSVPVKSDGLQGEIAGLFHALKERLLLIVLCVIVAASAARYFIATTPKVYASRAVLEVTRGEQGMSAFQNVNSADAASFDTLKTLELTIASQAVLMEAMRILHLPDDPYFAPKRPSGPYSEAELLDRLSSRVHVSLIRGTRLIQLVTEDRSPDKAQALAQTILNQFFNQNFNRRHQLSTTVHDSLLAEATRVSVSLEAAEQQLEEYREKYNAVSLTDRQNIVVDRLMSLNQQVAAATAERLSMESAREDMALFGANNILRLQEVAAIASQPSVAESRRVLIAQETEIATLKKRYGPRHPRMIEAETRRQELSAALETELRAASDLITRSYIAAKTKESALESSLKEQEKAALELDKIAIPFRAIEREVESNRLAYQQVQERLKVTSMDTLIEGERDRDFGNVRVIEQPLISERPIRPSPKKLYAIAVAGGVLIGSVIVLLLRAFDTTIRSIDEAEKILGVPVLAAIPFIRRPRRGRRIPPRKEAFSAEAFRSLRTSLNLLAKEQDLKSVLFVSALPAEGKSYCSLHYAISLTQQGFRTLLIDCDLRRPKMSLQTQCDSGAGDLSRAIRDPASATSLIKETKFPALFLLANAKPVRNAQELLSSCHLTELLKRVGSEFDRIVIDSAPIVAVSDALPIASLVSVVCLVVRAEKTPRRIVKRACQLLEEIAKRRPVGLVLNRTRLGKSGQYYYFDYAAEYASIPTLSEDKKSGAS